MSYASWAKCAGFMVTGWLTAGCATIARPLRKAMADGCFVETRSELGQAYLALGKMLMGVEEKKASSWFRK